MFRKLDKILSEPSSVDVQMSKYIANLSNPRLYEYYVFYKILECIPNMKQKGETKSHVFSNGKYTVEYQFYKYIEWKKDGDELN